MRNILFRAAALLSALSLTACAADEDTYPDDLAESEIGPYVRRFLQVAKEYGKNYDDVRLSYVFDDLDDDEAGVCDMNSHDPVKVRFDYEYWQTLTGPNADNMKEDLVFHELGHGLCRRYHDNATLARGDWRTIMCGDELPDGRGPSINYRGMRRPYYREELFTRLSDAPAWSLYTPDFSGVTYRTVFPYTSESGTVSYRDLFSGDGYENLKCTVSDGACTAEETKGETGYAGIRFLNWSSGEDFFMESEMSLSGTGDFGLLWGCMTDQDDTYPLNGHYMVLDGEGHVNIGEMTCGYSFIELYEEMEDPKSAKLGVRRHGDTLFYYLNDKFIYYNDLEGLPQGGGYIMAQVPPLCTLTMTSLTLQVPASGERRAAETVASPAGRLDMPSSLRKVWKRK